MTEATEKDGRTLIVLASNVEQRDLYDRVARRDGYEDRSKWIKAILARELPNSNFKSADLTLDGVIERLLREQRLTGYAVQAVQSLNTVKAALREAMNAEFQNEHAND